MLVVLPSFFVFLELHVFVRIFHKYHVCVFFSTFQFSSKKYKNKYKQHELCVLFIEAEISSHFCVYLCSRTLRFHFRQPSPPSPPSERRFHLSLRGWTPLPGERNLKKIG